MNNNVLQIVSEMNKLIYDSHFDIQEFDALLEALEKRDIAIRLLDFVNNDEASLKRIMESKRKFVLMERFDYAARLRDDEHSCRWHIQYREKLEVKQSGFIFEEGVVSYCYLQTAPYDERIYNYLKRLKGVWYFTREAYL